MTSPNTTTTGLNATDSSDFTQHSQVNGTSTRLHSGLSVKVDKIEYFRKNYDVMTGVRIAATLGGFFLFVLLSLIYKSKCKNKNSRPPSPIIPMTLDLSPAELNMPLTATMIDFVSPDSPPLRYRNFISPAVLLTTPNSKSASSEEEDEGSPCSAKKKKMKWLEQNIDIHVILPTPTISPSGSETFRHRREDEPPVRLEELGRVCRRDSALPEQQPFSHPIFFLDNLKYVDDTSSENIVTRGSEDEGDSRSIGSDSVFALFRHDDEPEDEEDVCRMILTQAHAEVHHRDSFTSDLDSFNEEEYLERSRRRSSSTQTTFSDLRQCLLKSYSGSRSGSCSGSHTPTNSSSNVPGKLLATPLLAIQHMNSHGSPRRSFDPSKKTSYTLQCDEPSHM